ncbi:MAG TPA: cobalamide ABC transporter substrate-binding protein [Elusimicrobia bacterium]|jgi:iron complex transport system substrate-binding protein|nr:cobalamide ABC transporter substrate-binding protein [Elusimicrobiota bacterium]
MGIVLFLLLVLGCSPSPPPTLKSPTLQSFGDGALRRAGTHQVTQSPKGQITASPYCRIISLAPSITEELYLLGVEEKTIAVTNYCDYPPQAKKKEKVGTLLEPNIEKIISLKPDIVFASLAAQDRNTINRLEKMGINIFTFGEVKNFEDISHDFLLLARMVGEEVKARKFLSGKEKEIKLIKQKVEKLPKVKVFLELGAKPLMTAGRNTFINEIVNLAGGVNIFRESKIEYPRVSLEEVIQRNPEVIILATMGEITEQEKDFWQKYKNLEAVKRNQIYTLDANIICRPTPVRYVEGLKKITEFLHSEEVLTK